MLDALKRWLQYGAPSGEKPERSCLCCGKCCEAFGAHLNASKSDLQRWKDLGREDILSRVIGHGWLWVNPETKQPEERCPFLKQAGPESMVCSIYEIRPDICRAYPTLALGRRCLRGVFL